MLADVATVGENFKRIRTQKQITQEHIYKKLGYQRPSNVSLLETSRRLPKPTTILKMAAVLDCETWELLEDVETPWDALREQDAIQRTGVSESGTPRARLPSAAQISDGAPFAPVRDVDQEDAFPGTSLLQDRQLTADVMRLVREGEAQQAKLARPPRPARVARKPVAADRGKKAGRRPRVRKSRG